ncbi:MAG: gamma-glutamyl-gamma-aminobutyrate hydrolase family protein [Clostridia bacterium]|nr:gamma-glutamyl-gamma-aminobutyrate hydrolase family protein [Clostridia bacterium]
MILIIDNYDGCANNLYQLAGLTDPDIRIARNDRIGVDEIERMAPSHIIISGGSCKPENAGVGPEAIRRFCGKIPVLGVCLGYRMICAAFGGQSEPMETIAQGKRQTVSLDTASPLFRGLPETISAGFYHSETVSEKNIPQQLKPIAWCDGVPAGVGNDALMLYGTEFHPESFLSEYGKEIMANFLKIVPPKV